MAQKVIKDGKVYCTTTVPYPTETIKSMKKAGYKVKEVEEKHESLQTPST